MALKRMGVTVMRTLNRLVGFVVILLIQAYRYLLAPIFVGHCRFEPSCSAYALEAAQVHGPWLGAQLALRRVLRCHPWVKAGYDPVPARTHTQTR